MNTLDTKAMPLLLPGNTICVENISQFNWVPCGICHPISYEMSFWNNLEQIPLSLTTIGRCFEFLCERWSLYLCHFNAGKAPFNDLLLSTVLEVDVARIGLRLCRAHMSLSPLPIPLSPQQAHARVLGLRLQILSWSVPMLPSALVSGSRSDPRCQLNLIKSSIMTESWDVINPHHCSFPIHM